MTTDNSTYRLAGSVTSTKKVYMRKQDMEDFEKELETSRKQTENPVVEDTTASVVPDESENTNSADDPNKAKPQVDSTDWKKRYSDLQSYSDKKLATKDQEILELKNQLKEKDQAPLPTTEAEFQDWITRYPPLYNIMRTIVLKEGKNDPELQTIKKEIEEVKQFKQDLANERGKLELLKIHPDAGDYDAGGSRVAEFGEWYKEQEPEIQALVDSGNPTKIGKAITLFKREKGIVTKSAQEKKKEQSKAVSVGPNQPDLPKEGKVWRESEVAKMSPHRYSENHAEIEKARREGRYVYDLSRAS